MHPTTGSLPSGFSPHFIVKHGRGVREREGQTLLFLKQHLSRVNSIAVPKLYAMHRLPSNGHLCLIMQRMEGESLGAMRPVLDNEESRPFAAR